MTKDNCRLLLIRLKMEGWVIGTTKVFLKYYNEEYLARLYETQVKKIIKVQSMMRAFLAKRNVATKFKQAVQSQPAMLVRKRSKDFNEEEAVVKIQTAFRGYRTRKLFGPLINQKTGKIDIATAKFIEPFAARWKKKSIYQILLHYRSIRHMDLVNFSQVRIIPLLSVINENYFHVPASPHLQPADDCWVNSHRAMYFDGEN